MVTTEPNNVDMNPETPSTRRSFFSKLWVFLGIIALAEFISILFAYFKPRKQRITSEGVAPIMVAGSVDKFVPGTVTAFVSGKFYLACLDDGGFLALSRTCTHLGCTVPWVSKENKFICPCHSSEFDIKGEVLSPPAPRALDIFEVSIENKIVKVDTGKRLKRSAFEIAQVVYPKADE